MAVLRGGLEVEGDGTLAFEEGEFDVVGEKVELRCACHGCVGLLNVGGRENSGRLLMLGPAQPRIESLTTQTVINLILSCKIVKNHIGLE